MAGVCIIICARARLPLKLAYSDIYSSRARTCRPRSPLLQPHIFLSLTTLASINWLARVAISHFCFPRARISARRSRTSTTALPSFALDLGAHSHLLSLFARAPALRARSFSPLITAPHTPPQFDPWTSHARSPAIWILVIGV